ncbi:MAG: cob(I)yrinic acid a,c-diamide adenosyltransferase [Gammaproteobacteria bacterium]|nr:cob(I)yrinic acid a,c-diamide adenosyltransferase [Gammaproteobacteria bacterium]
MGKRLSKIYTRTGDDGTTGLGDGARVPKTSDRITAMGDIDETNALLGLVIARLAADNRETGFLEYTQHRLFDLGGEISIPGMAIISQTHVTALESALDKMNEDLSPLDNFILPGGAEILGLIHLARSVCRRAERSLVGLSKLEAVNPAALSYLNRLSDYLFVLARWVAMQQSISEVLWQKDTVSGGSDSP